MAFLDETRSFLEDRLPDLQEELSEYVPRILIKGDFRFQDAGYIRGFDQFLSPSERWTLEDIQITTLPRVAVIGDAGSGKSFIIQKAFLESIQRFLDSADAPVPFLLDLGQHLIANRDIATALNHWHNTLFERTPSEHRPGCILFFDSLDEKLSKEPNPVEFINAVDLFLRTHGAHLSSVVLACRRAFWNSAWFKNQDPAFQVFHADHLEFSDYFHIIPDRDQRQDFFEHAQSLGISELLGSPFVGFDLARTYKRGEPLPSSRRKWFEGQVRKLLRGRPRDREDGGSPPISALVFLAGQMACLATWGTCSSWTVAEAVDQLGEASSLRDGQRVTRASVEVLLHRALFTKTGDRFSFSHQLFREYLAAEALAPLPIRKQRFLLTAAKPSLQSRILMPLRGIAVALAEASQAFADFLLGADPLVAFLAEATIAGTDCDERLLKTVIDNAIDSGLAYWRAIPPRGDRLEQALCKHRPRIIVSFLQPYLSSSDKMALLWATACAKAWGGAPELNEMLLKLAYDPEQHIEMRTNAIDAVLASRHREDIQELYGLLSSRDDRVRGHTLVAYRTTENPSPSEFIRLFRGGACDNSLYCILQMEAAGYGGLLDTPEELAEALHAVDDLYGGLGDLRPLLLGGLVQRAIELGFDDVPLSLFIKIWRDHTTFRDDRYTYNLESLLRSNRALFSRVWQYALDSLGQDERRRYWMGRLSDELAKACTDDIFDLIPPDVDALNGDQRRFVEDVLAAYFHQDRSIERLREFRRLAPAYTEHLRMPKSAMIKTGRDRLEEASKVAQALNREAVTALQGAWFVLSAIGEILLGQERIDWLDPAEVIQFLSELQAPLRQRVLTTFLDCVNEVEYSRTERRSPNTSRIGIVNPIYSVPFWVLWGSGLHELISVEKIDEFLRCYAFSGYPRGSEISAYFPLLDRLRVLSVQRWKECLHWLVEFPPVGLHGPLEYFTQRGCDVYLSQCRRRLLNCEFDSLEFARLFDYWQALKPLDFEETLRQCYECLEQQEGHENAPFQQFRILWLLLSQDNNWAWEELGRRVEAGTASPPANRPNYPASEQLPRSVARLPTIVNWFTLVRQTYGSAEVWHDDLGRTLLQTIVDIGGEVAIRELERLRRGRAFPGAEWLGHSVIEIQDRMLSQPSETILPGQLLDFINREVMGIIRDERDLFESVCQAIENEKESLEHGEQVGGYWKGDEPQTEPICQNILWPAVKRRLSNLGIVGVEEKHVGRNKVDFWVVKIDEWNQHWQVFVELKTARKGYARSELIDPLKEQLWQKYLEPAAKRFGIYVVLWFKDEGRYPYPTDWLAKEEFEQELQDRCADLAGERGIYVACYIVDMTAPVRKH